MALRELLAVGTVKQRQVGVARSRRVERLEDRELLRRVREMVVPADHLGDPHVRVVDGDGEVVERGAVSPGDHQIVGEPVLEANRAADQIVDHGLALIGDPQADRGALDLAGLAAIADVAVLGLPRLDVLGGRGVRIGLARLDQLGDPLAMARAPLCLAQRALVPLSACHSQRVEDLGDVLRSRALAVGVLDPQHERAAGTAGGEPVVEGGPRASDVERARRRRGEADSRFIGGLRTAGF